MDQSNWWRPAFWQDNGLTGLGFLPKVIEDLPDYLGVFDAGNHLHYAGAFATGLNVDIANTLEALSQVIDARRSTGDGRSSTCYSCLRDKSYLTWEQVIHLYGYVDLWGHLLLRLSAPPKRWIRVTVPVLAAW